MADQGGSGMRDVDPEEGLMAITTDEASIHNHAPAEDVVDATQDSLTWTYPDLFRVDDGDTQDSSTRRCRKFFQDALMSLTRLEIQRPNRISGVDKKFFEAANKGDWHAVENVLNEDPEVMKAEVATVGNESITVLDFAVIAAQEQVVKSLMKRLSSEHKENNLKKAIFIAVKIGRTRMVKALIENVESKSEIVPIALSYAIICTPMAKQVIWYLAQRTECAPDFVSMRHLILAGHLDIGCFLAYRYHGSTYNDNDKRSLLEELVTMKYCFPSEATFPSGATFNLLDKLIYKCIPLNMVNDNSEDIWMFRALKWFKISHWSLAVKSVSLIRRIGELKFTHHCSLKIAKLALQEMHNHMTSTGMSNYLTSGMVLDSVSHGTHEIIGLYINQIQEWQSDDRFLKELMKVAVKGRSIEFFRQVDAYNRIPKSTDDILTNGHLMEALLKWPPERLPANVPGAAFLLQRELQWFKVLEERSGPFFERIKFEVQDTSEGLEFKEAEDRRGKTYREVFVAQREDLHKEAGKWMKQTSSSCSVVAALIITVTFAAAFTVPGGYDPNTGIPILLKKGLFMVFVIADALALSFSIAATLMFLAIVTPYYTIEDFLQSLPRKMIMGITSIFLSLACMLVAFCSALAIMLNKGWEWIFFPIIVLAAVPVFFFFYIHFPMYVEMVQATYRPPLYRLLKIPQ